MNANAKTSIEILYDYIKESDSYDPLVYFHKNGKPGNIIGHVCKFLKYKPNTNYNYSVLFCNDRDFSYLVYKSTDKKKILNKIAILLFNSFTNDLDDEDQDFLQNVVYLTPEKEPLMEMLNYYLKHNTFKGYVTRNKKNLRKFADHIKDMDIMEYNHMSEHEYKKDDITPLNLIGHAANIDEWKKSFDKDTKIFKNNDCLKDIYSSLRPKDFSRILILEKIINGKKVYLDGTLFAAKYFFIESEILMKIMTPGIKNQDKLMGCHVSEVLRNFADTGKLDWNIVDL